MDLAKPAGGLVDWHRDLSELALGWATYNGDHMSMYAVNAGVPKTLVRHIVDYVAAQSDTALSNVLRDILATPVSPELLPPTDGEISQKTEDLVGPYELHDFFLYQVVRCGYAPGKVYRLARLAFRGRYPNEEILRWLQSFYRRFFQQQFKRSCLPDGPKVGRHPLPSRRLAHALRRRGRAVAQRAGESGTQQLLNVPEKAGKRFSGCLKTT